MHVVDDAAHYRIAVNVKSDLEPSELEYLIDSNFRHPVLDAVAARPAGWNVLERKPGGAALDFIRANLFNRDDMRKLPFDVPGPDNDLNEKLALYVRRAIADEHVTAYVFGERWGPEEGDADKIFGFTPAKASTTSNEPGQRRPLRQRRRRLPGRHAAAALPGAGAVGGRLPEVSSRRSGTPTTPPATSSRVRPTGVSKSSRRSSTPSHRRRRSSSRC